MPQANRYRSLALCILRKDEQIAEATATATSATERRTELHVRNWCKIRNRRRVSLPVILSVHLPRRFGGTSANDHGSDRTGQGVTDNRATNCSCNFSNITFIAGHCGRSREYRGGDHRKKPLISHRNNSAQYFHL